MRAPLLCHLKAGHFEEPLDFWVMREPAAAGGADDASALV